MTQYGIAKSFVRLCGDFSRVKVICESLKKKKGGKLSVGCTIGRSVYENLFVDYGTFLLDYYSFELLQFCIATFCSKIRNRNQGVQPSE